MLIRFGVAGCKSSGPVRSGQRGNRRSDDHRSPVARARPYYFPGARSENTRRLHGEIDATLARWFGWFEYFQGSPHFAVSRMTTGTDHAALIAELSGGHGGYNARSRGEAELLVIRCGFMVRYRSAPSMRHDVLPRFIGELRQALAAPGEAKAA